MVKGGSMRRRGYWIALAIVGACHRNGAEPAHDRADASAAAATSASAASTNDVMAWMDHGGCLGSCPSYRIEVRDDGAVGYEGRGSVKVQGHATRQLSSAELDQLRSAFDRARFANFDAGVEPMLDLPTIAFGYRTMMGMHVVQMFNQPALRQLETDFEGIVRAMEWIGEPNERPSSLALQGVLRMDDGDGGIPGSVAKMLDDIAK